MQYKISGRHLDIGQSLQTHVRQVLGSIVAKYAERPTRAHVTFSKDTYAFVCESTVHLSTGLTTNAHGRAVEIYEAFNQCINKMEKQLRRYKRRLKDHHSTRSTPVMATNAPAYILASEKADTPNLEPKTLTPVIIAEMEIEVKSLSVGEAVMQMELIDAPVLIFKNERHNGLNVVFRRKDGNVGWIDPENIQ